MAKKIILSFSGQPEIGKGFSYNILIDGTNVVYQNGSTSVLTEYVNFGIGNNPPKEIERQLSLNNTIENTLSFLLNNYVYSNIYYNRNGNTIEITVNTSLPINISFGFFDSNITQSVIDVPEVDSINLRYFFQYKNIVNDDYRCEIYNKQYFGNPLEIVGRATLEKSSVKDHLEPIRGTGLSLDLEATTEITLEDLYSENEQDFTVRLYKNGNIIFIGFLKPDGIYQSFTRDVWTISLTCIDGLGAIENLSFVQQNGLRFVGKMTAIDIIYNCLLRTGISLPINTSINTVYDGLTRNDNLDILTKIQLNSDRFFRIDGQSNGNGTIMSCKEVLTSVLDIFCACITQKDGEWFIYKPNELFLNQYPLFRKYDINNNYIANITLNLSKKIGSQIDNFYPYHCNGDQKIEIKGGVSAFRINYKYGFVSGLVLNSNFIHNGLVFQNWTINQINYSFLINDPLINTYMSFFPQIGTGLDRKLIATSDNIPQLIGDTFKFVVTMRANGFAQGTFRIRLGNYFLSNTGEWTLNVVQSISIETAYTQKKTETPISITRELESKPLPISGNVYIEIYVPQIRFGDPENGATRIDLTSLDLAPTNLNDPEVGEFYTVERSTRISTIVKENKTIYNGDNAGIKYLGAIFKQNGLDTTSLWNRVGEFTSKPILRIAAEEELRISQKPTQVFSGSIFGFLPYLSVFEINNISGKLMPIEYSYDTFSNVTKLKSLTLFSAEIPDIIYSNTFDYGNTVKPTIKG